MRKGRTPDKTTVMQRQFYKLVTKVVVLIAIAVGILFLGTGCKMTETSAERKVLRVHAAHKNVLDRWCAEWNPISVITDTVYESTGDTVLIPIPGEPVFVNCDTVKDKTKPVPCDCPPQYLVRHFPLQVIRTTVENTAAADSARASSRKYQLEATKQESAKITNRNLLYGSLGFNVLLVVGVVLFWKFKLKNIVKPV